MPATLPERAAQIQSDFEKIPTTVVQQNKQFFDDVWNFCGAVIDAYKSDDGGQFIAPSLMGD